MTHRTGSAEHQPLTVSAEPPDDVALALDTRMSVGWSRRPGFGRVASAGQVGFRDGRRADLALLFSAATYAQALGDRLVIHTK